MTTKRQPATPPPHRARRLDAGEYEYRGFIIFDRGGGRSGHERMLRHSPFRWKVVKKTGPGYFDRESTLHDGFTLRDAKSKIDRALLRELGED